MMTNKDILINLKGSNVSQILETCPNSSERGVMYEALWNIVVKFNCLSDIKIENHIKSNLNKTTKVRLTDFSSDFLLKSYKSGNSSGYSDITFKDKTKTLYVSTVKFFENDAGKNRDDWDFPKLAALQAIHGNTKNIVFTRNKEAFLTIYNNANKNDIHTFEKVYDLTDLHESMKRVLSILDTYMWDFDALVQRYFGKQKSQLTLLFHQELCLLKTSKMSADEPILWGLKCRSGKSYIMAGHIHQNKFSNVLIITPIPNESIKSLTSLFQQYVEFDGYTVIHVQRGTKIPTSEKKILIASKQYLDKKEISSLKDIAFDAVYSDENHWGGTTENSKDIVKKYVKQGRTQFVTLTATYLKSKTEWNIPHEQSFFWDLEDEMLCKSVNVDSLKEKYGDDVNSVLDHHDLSNEYTEMPILTLLSVTHDPAFVSKFKQFNTDDSYSFDTTNLLKCVDGDFISTNKTCVQDLVDYHFGDGLNNGKNMMDRIKTFDTRTGSEFHTQLWFLPYGSGNNLNETAKSLKALIGSHKYGKKFAIEILTSENDNSEKGSLYEYIQSLENRAIEESKRGLILLLGFKCSMGISLPLADVVVLLNNGESMDMYMQMMMRSMTESRGTNKKRGFVIDYNQKRVLQTSLNMVRSGTMSIRENIEKSLNVAPVDEDMAVRDKTSIVDKIYDIWKKSNGNPIDMVRKKLEQLPIVKISDFHRKSFKDLMTVCKDKKKSNKETVELNSDDEKLPDGTSVTSTTSKKSLSEKKDIEVEIDYLTKIFKDDSIATLVGLITYKQHNTIDILQCLEIIHADDYLQSIFVSQCKIWWEVSDSEKFVKLLVEIINTYYLNDIGILNTCIEIMKEGVTRLLDNKKELLDLINSMLKPKDVEKRKFGEVFTPLEWIEKMLDLLPLEVWSNPSLKWYDPANGIGNFMVCVYYRIMDGLQDVIKDEDDRKIHIIKNMLFMSELNSKNAFVCKTIFGEKCNLYEGDSLSFDFQKVWNISTDELIIVGNPPYNKELTRSGGSPFYNEFIERFIDNCKYLLFIVPSRWFSGGKGLDKFRNMMLARKDIQNIIHNPNSKDIFGSGVDIEGGINYFLKNKTYNGLCNFNNSMLDLSQFDIVIDNKYQTIIQKMNEVNSITSIYQGRCFGIETNDKHLTNDKTLVKCYVSKQKGFEKYIDQKYISKDYNFWKVVTAEANGKSKRFGNIFVASPTEIHSGSYISFKVGSEDEAKSLKSYMLCKLPNFLLGLRKASQHINEGTCKWIPLPPLDRIWTDEDVYNYFKISKKEIDMIKS